MATTQTGSACSIWRSTPSSCLVRVARLGRKTSYSPPRRSSSACPGGHCSCGSAKPEVGGGRLASTRHIERAEEYTKLPRSYAALGRLTIPDRLLSSLPPLEGCVVVGNEARSALVHIGPVTQPTWPMSLRSTGTPLGRGGATDLPNKQRSGAARPLPADWKTVALARDKWRSHGHICEQFASPPDDPSVFRGRFTEGGSPPA